MYNFPKIESYESNVSEGRRRVGRKEGREGREGGKVGREVRAGR